MFRQLPDVTATVQASLHRVDATPLQSELGAIPAGPERWFGALDEQVRAGAEGLGQGLDWLVEHQPPQPARLSICHGDLWGGNILAEDGRVTGVLDWTAVTVADPALDVGFAAMSMSLAPIDAPRPVQRVAARIGGAMCTRFVRTYQHETGADLSTQPYYEALRCAIELSLVAAYRMAEARGVPHDVPKLTWNSIPDHMVSYFRTRTGVTLRLPD
jgi:aminoglycoside phosphotransferase (APT) family kinase protein